MTPLEGFRQDPYFDTKGIATIGYGFNIETNPDARLLVLNQLGVFAGRTDLEIANISEDFRQLILGVTNGNEVQLVNALNTKLRDYLGPQTTTLFLLDQTQARTVFNQILGNPTTGQTVVGQNILVQGKQAKLDAILGSSVPHNTKEYVALMSLFYNSEGLVKIGSQLVTAIIDDNRAEAWYQIRYNSNNGESRVSSGQGIANRRFQEADVFGLYGTGPISDIEAKEVLQMYTKYHDLSLAVNGIRAYDAQFSPTNPIDVEISPARDHLIANFAEGRTIDGEVLVGQNEVAQGDVLEGTASGDLLFGEQGTDVLRGGVGADVLYGGAGIDTLSGGTENDLLRGEAGNDTLQGGAGDDLLEGGAGFDTYIYKTGDGNDRIEDSDATGVIVVNGKMLTGGVKKAGQNDWISSDGTLKYLMSGTDLVVQLNGITIMTVNEDFQSGQFGIKLIDGPAITTEAPSTVLTISGDFEPLDIDLTEEGVQIGYDELGNIILDPGRPGDHSDLLNGSGNNDTLNGGALRDRLTALGGSDVLVGGSDGDGDVLIGQDGNDQLFGDQLVDVASLTSFENVGGTENDRVVMLVTSGSVDVADGGTGIDTLALVGTVTGNGVVTVDLSSLTDQITLIGGVADNTLIQKNFENLDASGLGSSVQATGSAGANILIGSDGADMLAGGLGNDTLDGGAGDDTLDGGAGNNIYVVESLGDTVTEMLAGAAGGTDVVQSAAANFTLGPNVEHLTLIGSADSTGTGNTLNNILTGNSGDNTLTGDAGNDQLIGGEGDDTLLGGLGNDMLLGGTGADQLDGGAGTNSMAGGVGNDTYTVDAATDLVTEGLNAGTDTVNAALTYTLGANVENLTLTGNDNWNGTGNTLANVLTGNAGNNVLNGGVGDDTFLGGAGNDTYVIGLGTDILTENLNEGTDTVQSTITHTLGANFENLTLTGGEAVNGTGNELANVLTGNAAANVLAGEAGNDTLLGGVGNDTFFFSLGDGQDLVQDNSGTADKILFDSSINPLDLVISRQANDLRVAIHGSADQITVQNWFTSPVNRTETIQAGNGQMLLSSQVDQLIQAMAGFTTQTGLTWNQGIDQQPQTVQAILAANWQ